MSKKIALVTGANRGIGRAIAERLAKDGFHCVLAVRRPENAETTLRAIGTAGGSAEALQLDVTDTASIERAAAAFGQRHERLDVLINNAGIMVGMPDTLLDAPDADIDRALATNTYGPLRVTRAFLPWLRKSDSARVVNMSSRGGQIASITDPNSPLDQFQAGPYRLSKLALNGVTVLLAKALAADSILVNAMCPGWVRTDMGGPEAPSTPEEGADTAVWLATLPAGGPTGGFFGERTALAW